MQKAYIKSANLKPVEITIPGSKSYTNRALLIASLANGKSTLTNPLFSDDTIHMTAALKKLGVNIEQIEGDLIVHGTGGKFLEPKGALYLGNAGTGIRFLTALLALVPYKSKITGNARMKERPIKDLVSALRNLGVKIETGHKNGCPPVKIKGGTLKGGEIEISGKISSQYLSALLMIAPYAKNKIVIKIKDDLVSKPYVDMTIEIMKSFGITVKNNNYESFEIETNQKYTGIDYEIEGDASSASYFFALSALHNIPIKIKGINPKTAQADINFLDVLGKMGCKIEKNNTDIQITRKSDALKPLGEIDLNHMPDAAMTVAVLATFAKGKSTLKNIENLRVKETDRIKALVTELKKLNVDCKELKDGIEINGDPEKMQGPTLIKTYDDHRMAMCFAVIASKVPKLQILDPDCTSKTYPRFFEDLQKVGIEVDKRNIPNIVLTGMRACGKSRLGRVLAKMLHMKFIDTDDEIEKQEKMKIHQLVAKKSWFAFRKKEKYVVRKFSKLKNCVISTGGGVIIDKENEKSLKKNGFVVFLNCDLDIIVNRIKNSKTKRPALTKNNNLEEEIKDIWNKRKERYTKSADLIFDTSEDLPADEKVQQLLMQL